MVVAHLTLTKDGSDQPAVVLDDLAKEVSLCHILHTHGNYLEFETDSHPKMSDDCPDPVAGLFAAAEIPNFVAKYKQVRELSGELKKEALRQGASDIVPKADKVPDPADCRRSRRNNKSAAVNLIRTTETVDGVSKTVVLEERIDTPEYKRNLQEEAKKLRRRLGHSSKLFKKLTTNVDEEGVVQLPQPSANGPGEGKPKRPKRTDWEAKYDAASRELKRLKTQPKTDGGSSTTSLQQQLSLSQSELGQSNLLLADKHTQIATLQQELRQKNSEIMILESQIKCAAAETKAAVAHARAETMERCYNMGSRSVPTSAHVVQGTI
jgi:hypothetical protein